MRDEVKDFDNDRDTLKKLAEDKKSKEQEFKNDTLKYQEDLETQKDMKISEMKK
jgi:hypothetical protein